MTVKRCKWVIEIEVDDCWVADGFEITNDNIIDKIQTLIPYAYSHEVAGKVLKAPRKSRIDKLQS